MVVSVLLMLTWFALPSASHATARAEMTAATEQVRYTVDSARKLARMTESTVVLGVSDAPGPGGQALTFYRERSGSSGPVQHYRLPDGVRLHADRDSYTFDDRGLAAQAGRLVLLSTRDETITATVPVD